MSAHRMEAPAELRLIPVAREALEAAALVIGVVLPKKLGMVDTVDAYGNAREALEALVEHAPEQEKADAPGYVLGFSRAGARNAANADQPWPLMVLDVEGKAEGQDKRLIGPPAPSPADMLARLRAHGLLSALASTWSHAADNPRYRLLFAVSRPVAHAEIRPLGVALSARLGLSECLDTSCLEPARFFYWPSYPPEREHLACAEVVPGYPVDVDALLAEQAPAMPPMLEPIATQPSARKGESVIEAFNAAHDLSAIIERHGYKRAGADRWLWPGSTSGEPGVHLLDSGRVFSHHANDPLHNPQGCDAFEAWVRLEHGGDKRRAVREAALLLGMEHAPRLAVVEVDEPEAAAPLPPAAPELVRWPEPFRGCMAEVVAETLRTAYKPQPALAVLCTLLGMAGSIGGRYGLPDGTRLNLYGLAVARSASGKDHLQHVARSLARCAGAKLLAGIASGEALEDALVARVGMLSVQDEIAHVLEALNAPKAAAHLQSLARNLLTLFSAGRSTYALRIRAKENKGEKAVKAEEIAHPTLSLIGFATPEKLGKALGASSIEDGLLGRMLFCLGDDPVHRAIDDGFEVPALVRETAERIADGGAHGCIVDFATPAVRALRDEMLMQFDGQVRAASDGLRRLLASRSIEKAQRVAGVLAVWDDPETPRITAEHLDYAGLVLGASNAHALHFLERHIHGGEVQAWAAQILQGMRELLAGQAKAYRLNQRELLKQGKVPHSALLQNVDKHMNAQQAGLALTHLIEAERIELVQVPPKGKAYRLLE